MAAVLETPRETFANEPQSSAVQDPDEYNAHMLQEARAQQDAWGQGLATRYGRQHRQIVAAVYLGEASGGRPAESRSTALTRGTSRERRRATGTSRGRARSPNDDSDPEPPGLERVCRGCNKPFYTHESRRWHCSDKCKSRASTAKHRENRRGRILQLFDHEPLVWELVRSGQLDPWSGLLWTVFPELMRMEFYERRARQDGRIAKHSGVAA
jgi:hypothetical protein